MSTLARPLGAATAPGPGVGDDFDLWWSLPGDWVEAPNERRNGWSGVVRTQFGGRRCYIKRQCNHLCRTPAHPFGWPTASREWHYLHRLHALGIVVPLPLYHASRPTAAGVEAVLATAELTGFTPLSAQTGLTAPRRQALATAVGHMLGVLHRARLQHGCLYDKHVMVCWRDDQAQVALLDLEKMRPRLRRSSAARRDLAQLRRHQSLWSDTEWNTLLHAHALAMAGAH